MRNGRAVAHELNISLKFQGSRWSGELHLPKGISMLAGSYQLHLHDGRAGRIMLHVVDGETVFFEGDGELKRS
jgi:hypothetical protein